jgi:hypothetical protein
MAELDPGESTRAALPIQPWRLMSTWELVQRYGGGLVMTSSGSWMTRDLMPVPVEQEVLHRIMAGAMAAIAERERLRGAV